MRSFDPVRRNQLIFIWLFTTLILLFIMVVLGGVTRLTHSGLSMVKWEPLTGWMPPMNDLEWMEVFSLYKQYPEFKKINLGMSLEEFKQIYWFEFVHRLWGRILGVVFLVPFIFFKSFGWIKGKLVIHFFIVLGLGFLQGVLGWFMVKSGLTDEPDVSQYRLAMHLCLAFLIFGYLIGMIFFVRERDLYHLPVSISIFSKFLTGIIFLTVFSGALVAGLDAGLVYNTFPLMDGEVLPSGLFSNIPIYLNFFENVLTVQFNHRVLAMLCIVSILIFWLFTRGREISNSQVNSINLLLIAGVLQVILGISTLLLRVPVSIAALHQAGALILFGTSVWVAFSFHQWNKTIKG